MNYFFMSQKYYDTYTSDNFPQLELKTDRPYTHIILDYNGREFAVPLRSNIKHPHAYFTNKKLRCGVDYSKAVPIIDDSYIDKETVVRLRPDEFKKLQGKSWKLHNEFNKYVELYKEAKNNLELKHRDDILKFSSLQYFEEYIM